MQLLRLCPPPILPGDAGATAALLSTSPAMTNAFGAAELRACVGSESAASATSFSVLSETRDALQYYRLGAQLGVAAALMAWVLWDCGWEAFYGGRGFAGLGNRAGLRIAPVPVWLQRLGSEPVAMLYRGLANLLWLYALWGCVVLVWNRVGVNYQRIFNLKSGPIIPLPIFLNASLLFILFLLNFLVI